ncbi:MAG: CoA transferase, partial [Rhizobacter sp.]|nr:CoA transferase [Rhizobacter sp.]
HDHHLKKSGGLVAMRTEDGGTTDLVLLPITLDGRRLGVRRALPRVGEHDEEVLGALGARPGDPAASS